MSASTKNLLALSESILASTTSVKEAVPVGVDPIVDDGLKTIVVPDTFVENVINFSHRLDENDPASHKEVPVQNMNEAQITKNKIVSIVERLKLLIGEARQVIQEMTSIGTSSGMIAQGVQKKLGMIRKPSAKKSRKRR